jgi:hypothetical protein
VGLRSKQQNDKERKFLSDHDSTFIHGSRKKWLKGKEKVPKVSLSSYVVCSTQVKELLIDGSLMKISELSRVPRPIGMEFSSVTATHS